MPLGTYMERQKPTDGVLTARTLGYAFAMHLAAFIFFWGVAKIAFRAPDVIIPIDMTIVPPWAEQTDDPDPDPNPPPSQRKPSPSLSRSSRRSPRRSSSRRSRPSSR